MIRHGRSYGEKVANEYLTVTRAEKKGISPCIMGEIRVQFMYTKYIGAESAAQALRNGD